MYAFECALNFLLYTAGPDPEVTEVGGPGEMGSISRREQLADVYARVLLVEVTGDIGRATAVASEASLPGDASDVSRYCL